MHWRAFVHKLVNKGRPLAFSPAVTHLFAHEGLEPLTAAREDDRCRLYLRVGRWLVEPRHLGWFLSYIGPGWQEFSGLRYVYLGCADGARAEPPRLIRYKEELGKIALFDARGQRKRALWSKAETFDRALRGCQHFARSTMTVPHVLAYDRREKVIEERLFDSALMRSSPTGTRVLLEVARFQATHYHSVLETGTYVETLRPHEAAQFPWLNERAHRALEACFARLIDPTRPRPSSRCYLTWSHNDLSPANVLGDDIRPICVDFEQSGEATIWFDPIYMFLTWESIDEDDLVAALELSYRLVGAEPMGLRWLDWHLDLFCLELFQQTCFLLQQSDELPMPRIHLLHRVLASR
jgi:thiamine kinase-like enzyme